MQDLQKDGVEKAVPGRCEPLPKAVQCPTHRGLRNLSALFLNTLKCIAAGRFCTPACRPDKKESSVTLRKWLCRHGDGSGFLAHDGEAGKPDLLRKIVGYLRSMLFGSRPLGPAILNIGVFNKCFRRRKRQDIEEVQAMLL